MRPSLRFSDHISTFEHTLEDSSYLVFGNLKVELQIEEDRGTPRKRYLVFPKFAHRSRDLHPYNLIVSKFLRDKMPEKIDTMIEDQDSITSYAIGFENAVWLKSLRLDPEQPVIQRYKISGTQAQYENLLAKYQAKEKSSWNSLAICLSPIVSTVPLAPEMETLAQAFFGGQGIPEVIHVTDEIKGSTAPNHIITYNTGYWSTIIESDIAHDPVIAPFLLQMKANNEMEECVRKGCSYFGMQITRSNSNEVLRSADVFNGVRWINVDDLPDLKVFKRENSLYYIYMGGIYEGSTKDSTKSVNAIEAESSGEHGSDKGRTAEDGFKGDKANGNKMDDCKANDGDFQGKKLKKSKKVKRVNAEKAATRDVEQSEDDDKADVSKKPEGLNNDESTRKKRRRAKKKPKKEPKEAPKEAPKEEPKEDDKEEPKEDDSWMYDAKPDTTSASYLETKTKPKKKRAIKTKKEATSAEAPDPLKKL
ncbi:hypothetical protein B7494_g2539 [Chlorociboria aeruginascens]|nr:hypothetical protein B7494_g2539 [Chlorociboria aeruginascens]